MTCFLLRQGAPGTSQYNETHIKTVCLKRKQFIILTLITSSDFCIILKSTYTILYLTDWCCWFHKKLELSLSQDNKVEEKVNDHIHKVSTYSQVLTWVWEEKCPWFRASGGPWFHKVRRPGFGPFLASFDPFWPHFQPVWAIQEPFGPYLGPSKARFGPFWLHIRLLRGYLGPFWPRFGLFWAYLSLLEAWFARFGSILSFLGAIWSVLGLFGAIVTPFRFSDPFWSHFQPVWDYWGPYWPQFGSFWAYLGPLEVRFGPF